MGQSRVDVYSTSAVASVVPPKVEISLRGFKNLTTNTEPKPPYNISIIELEEQNLILQIPRGYCAKGHNLLLDLTFKNTKTLDELPFSSTCMVAKSEQVDARTEIVALKLLQYNKKDWNDCIWMLMSSQNEANSLLRMIKDSRPDLVIGEEETNQVRVYLRDSQILIADANAATRATVQKIFCELGVPAMNVFEAPSFVDAHAEIDRVKPHIIVADYRLGAASGLALIRKQRAVAEDSRGIFVLITENHSQTVVARAAEEDIDAYVIKPFSSGTFQKALISAAVDKLMPSPYQQAIETGKDLLEKKEFTQAEVAFAEALKLDPKPALAHYYLGEAKRRQKQYDLAEKSFKQGLELNKIHAKCLSGLYSTLADEKSFEAAYDVLKKILQYFPVSPEKLEEVLRLAIRIKRYEDIEKYYAVFNSIEEREEALVKYICAALIVCAKHYLQTANRSRALELLESAAKTCGAQVSILREVVRASIEFNLAKEAKEYLERFPQDKRGEEFEALAKEVAKIG